MNDEEPAIGWKEALSEEASNPPEPLTTGQIIYVFAPCTAPGCRGGEADGEPCQVCKGSGHTAEVLEEHHVSTCETRIMGQFEEWVQANAERAIGAIEARRGPEEAAEMRDAYLAAWGAKSYTWEGRACRQARKDFEGLTYLLYLLLRRCNPKITHAKAKQIFKANSRGCAFAIAWALGNSQPPATGDAGGNGAGVRTKTRRPPAPEDTPSPVMGLTPAEWEAVKKSRRETRPTEGPRETVRPQTLDSPGA